RFHEIIGEMADNAFLKPSLERLLIDHARIGHTFFRPKDDGMNARLLLACKHHDLFIEAIAEHNEQAVVDLVFEHWELSRRDMEMFIAPKGLAADALVPAPNSSMESVSRSSKASTHAPSRRSHRDKDGFAACATTLSGLVLVGMQTPDCEQGYRARAHCVD